MILGTVTQKTNPKMKCARRSVSLFNKKDKEVKVTKRKTSLWSRWQRSRSRERCPAGTIFTLAPGHDSSGTEYTGDQSSEHSTPAHSPRHRMKRGKKGTDTISTLNPVIIQLSDLND
ncbi:unnamed protein product [Arctia plantaginis]|uniref:Uncharacterized protein n=1 Tax=Arctia plantaginis TaxID=874455 RepID=A0A8S0Z2A1_ARCPL|nr:unnamed protein product [Arctia plantaginis]